MVRVVYNCSEGPETPKTLYSVNQGLNRRQSKLHSDAREVTLFYNTFKQSYTKIYGELIEIK